MWWVSPGVHNFSLGSFLNWNSSLFWSVPSVLFSYEIIYTLFFISNAFVSTQPQCCLTFSWTDLQMLLRCCLIHIALIILTHILYLVYLCPFLTLGLFMPYLCDLLFSFSLIFIVINHITPFKHTYFLFVHFSLVLFIKLLLIK